MDKSFFLDANDDLKSRHYRSVSGNDVNLSEIAAPAVTRTSSKQIASLERRQSQAKTRRLSQPLSHHSRDDELTELAAGEPNPRRRDEERGMQWSESSPTSAEDEDFRAKQKGEKTRPQEIRSQFATEVYTHGYLIFFSILGVLARLGVEGINIYPGAPAITPVLWANFGGSFFFGFLLEDQRLFREEWGIPTSSSFEGIKESKTEEDKTAIKKKHATVKKTIPLYIGLSTGFCGTFTSFSSFIRDAFLALSNSLHSPNTPSSGPIPARERGYSVNALLAVIILQLAVSLSALHFGAHTALAFDRLLPSLPFRFCRRFLDPLTVILGIGCWAAAVILIFFTPNHDWRGQAIFACVFGPAGCLIRYYASRYLNARVPQFPLGTFLVNVFGTVVLAVCYDLQHSPDIVAVGEGSASVLGCQILQGVMEGFCGALTTVSTWVGELNALRRRHAYLYGVSSFVVSFAFLTVIMGSVRWSQGFGTIACKV